MQASLMYLIFLQAHALLLYARGGAGNSSGTSGTGVLDVAKVRLDLGPSHPIRAASAPDKAMSGLVDLGCGHLFFFCATFESSVE